MESGTQADFYIHRHRVRFVPPDIMRVWWIGQCTREEFVRVIEYSEECMGHRRHFVIADFSQSTSIDPAVRRQASKDERVRQVIGIAMIGTTFHVRVMMTMITKAVEILYGESRGKMRFFDTEGEALDWITQERERLGLVSGEPDKGYQV